MVLASHRRGGHNSENVLEIDLIRKLFIKGRTTRLVKTLRGPKRAGERQPKSVLPASAGPACWASCFPHRLGLDRQGFAASRSPDRIASGCVERGHAAGGRVVGRCGLFRPYVLCVPASRVPEHRITRRVGLLQHTLLLAYRERPCRMGGPGGCCRDPERMRVPEQTGAGGPPAPYHTLTLSPRLLWDFRSFRRHHLVPVHSCFGPGVACQLWPSFTASRVPRSACPPPRNRQPLGCLGSISHTRSTGLVTMSGSFV